MEGTDVILKIRFIVEIEQQLNITGHWKIEANLLSWKAVEVENIVSSLLGFILFRSSVGIPFESTVVVLVPSCFVMDSDIWLHELTSHFFDFSQIFYFRFFGFGSFVMTQFVRLLLS